MIQTLNQTAEAALERFIETAKEAGCPRDQIENFLGAGYIPQPEQLKFHAAARAADQPGQPNKIAAGGDRAGAKSHAIVCQLTLDDCQRYPGLDILYLRRIGKAAKKAMEQLREKTFLPLPHEWNRNTGLVEFPNGSSVVIGNFRDDSDIEKYQGLEYDIIAVEESTQLAQSTKDLLRGSLRSSKPGWRTRLYEAANPGGRGHVDFRNEFVIPYKTGNETDTRFIPMSWRDNAFVDPEYVRYLNSLTGSLRRMWRDGDWDVSAGQFFSNWHEPTHVVEPFTITPDMPLWASLDHGFSHPTAVYWHTRKGGNIYTIAEHCVSRQLVPFHARRIKEITRELNHRVSDIEAIAAGHDCFAQRGDSNGKTIAQQYEDEGIHLERANIDRVNGAAEMLRRLGGEEGDPPATWFIFNTCKRLISCIPQMQVNPRRPEDVLKVDADRNGENGDDPYDGARYGLMVEKKEAVGGFAVQY
jgi:phage terminase large subunit